VAVAVTVRVAVMITVGVPFFLRIRARDAPGVSLGVETCVKVTGVMVPVGVVVGVSVNKIVMVPVAVAVAVTTGVRVPVEVSLTVAETVGVTLDIRVMVPPGSFVIVPLGVAPADAEPDVSAVVGPNGAAGAEVPPQERLMNKQGPSPNRVRKINCNKGLLTAPRPCLKKVNGLSTPVVVLKTAE
jgi:hypothetical protein